MQEALVPIGNYEHYLHLIIFPPLMHSLPEGNALSHVCLFTRESGSITSLPQPALPSHYIVEYYPSLPCPALPHLPPLQLRHRIDPHPTLPICGPYIYWQWAVGLSCNKKTPFDENVFCAKNVA